MDVYMCVSASFFHLRSLRLFLVQLVRSWCQNDCTLKLTSRWVASCIVLCGKLAAISISSSIAQGQTLIDNGCTTTCSHDMVLGIDHANKSVRDNTLACMYVSV